MIGEYSKLVCVTSKAKRLLRSTMVGVIVMGLSTAVSAGSVTANIKFDKRPAKVGVLYVPGEGPATNAELDQENKAFTSKMLVVSPGAELKMKNSDDLDHNIFANDIKSGVQFDVGLMPANTEMTRSVDWAEDTLIRVGCKIHPTMKAYVANVKAKVQQAMTFEKGKNEYAATLDNFSEGDKVVLMLNKYERIEVDFSAGKTQTVELMKKGKRRGEVTFTLN